MADDFDAYWEREHGPAMREFYQVSGAEVPGFHARTVIDDTIGKLFAVRSQLVVEIPDGLAAVLDDIEEHVERLIELAYDADGEPVAGEVPCPPGVTVNNYGGGDLAASGSRALYWCSCGQPGVSAAFPRQHAKENSDG